MAEQRDDNYSGVWDGRLGFGKKSALVVIDLLKGYTTEGSPLYAPGVVDACNEAPELIDAARKAGIDIFHTQVRYNEHNFIDGGVWIKKAPVLPAEGETVITKQYASVFFGTSFAATLTAAGIDTLIITGCTTSGCIRATAVDCVQNGFRPICVRECIGDRHNDPHEANLFDINAKYGDVISKAECIEYLNGLG